MKRIIMAVVLAVVASSCSIEQLNWWLNAGPDEQQLIAEHILREAAAEFGADADHLVEIARCESGLRPWAYNPSGASGLLQHMRQYWPARAEAVGMPGASPFDPVANARAGAWMLANDPSARPWFPSKHCWG